MLKPLQEGHLTMVDYGIGSATDTRAEESTSYEEPKNDDENLEKRVPASPVKLLMKMKPQQLT